jgi:transcriptional antiterminator NusG
MGVSDEAKPANDLSSDEQAGGQQIDASTEAVETVPARPGADSAPDDAPADGDQSRLRLEEDDEREVAEWADDDDLQALADEQAAQGDAEGDVEDVAPLEETLDVEPDQPMIAERPIDWYILKVQSNREDSIASALQRRVKVAGFEEYFEEIIVPVEMVTEFKGGKKRVVKRKLYPGYIVVHMIINDETWFLVRETPGIGDFTGSAGRPTPMLAHEVARIVPKDEDVQSEEPKLQIGVSLGDRVKINEGTFENFEGEVDTIDVTNGRVTVMINIFGRSTPVELEYWQIEKL